MDDMVRRHDEFDETDPGYRVGKVEWDCKQAIRALFLVLDFEAARERVAMFINEQAGGRYQ